MKRRKFLENSFVAGAAAILAPASAFATTGASSAPTITHEPVRFSRAWFETFVNSEFRIETPDGSSIDARLINLPDRGSSAKHHQFTAVFELPDSVTAGGLCWIEHPAAGRFQLHLDEASRVGAINVCQAQFNQLV